MIDTVGQDSDSEDLFASPDKNVKDKIYGIIPKHLINQIREFPDCYVIKKNVSNLEEESKSEEIDEIDQDMNMDDENINEPSKSHRDTLQSAMEKFDNDNDKEEDIDLYGPDMDKDYEEDIDFNQHRQDPDYTEIETEADPDNTELDYTEIETEPDQNNHYDPFGLKRKINTLNNYFAPVCKKRRTDC